MIAFLITVLTLAIVLTIIFMIQLEDNVNIPKKFSIGLGVVAVLLIFSIMMVFALSDRIGGLIHTLCINEITYYDVNYNGKPVLKYRNSDKAYFSWDE